MTEHAAPLRKEIEDLATSQIAEVYYAGRDHPRLLPFWFGEAPARTRELCEEMCEIRELQPAERERQATLPPEAARALDEYLDDCRRSLGTVPTTRRMVLERFFDESAYPIAMCRRNRLGLT